MKITKSLYVLIGALMITGATTTVQAVPTFQHTLGYAGNVANNRLDDIGAATYVQIDSLQPVHETTLVIYAKQGEQVQLIPPAYTSRYAFRRWYGENDKTFSGLNFSQGFDTDKGHVVLRSKDSWDVKNMCWVYKVKNGEYPTITFGGERTFVYCDQSNYTDYHDDVDWLGRRNTFTEGTLSQRVKFDIRPAADIAKVVDTKQSTAVPTVDDTYLEEYKRIAPKNRVLYLGPAYQFYGSGDAVYTNYYYNQANPNKLADATWEWRSSEGEYINLSNNSDNVINNQYIKASYSGTEENKEVVYTLTAKVDNTYYKIAKFTVAYLDPKEYGPIAEPTKASRLSQMKQLAYRDFNTFKDDPTFSKPGTTDPTFYAKHLGWGESTYGFYYTPLKDQRREGDNHGKYGDPYFGDYAFINTAKALSTAGHFANNVYNHGNTNSEENAKDGYFLYIDGAQKPGTCFTIQVHNTNLCAGMTIWFSGYVAVLNTNDASPLLNFAIEGKEQGKDFEAITTYVSGRLAKNSDDAADTFSYPSCGQWLHILFPVKIEDGKNYEEFRLVITNKGKGSTGNDFAIDDIGLYLATPDMLPLQASSNNDICTNPKDGVTTYFRIACEEAHMLEPGKDKKYVYQWQYQGQWIDMPYYSPETDATYGKYGTITLPTGEPELKYQYLSLTDFEAIAATKDNAIGYVQEDGYWVLYIATRTDKLQPGKIYDGYIATSLQNLMNNQCGATSQLEIKGSMYMTINNEHLLDGTTIDICNNRLLRLGVERLLLTTTKNGMEEHKAICSADWLWGTPDYINANPALYGATYDEIKAAILDGTNDDLLQQLVSRDLLVRNKKDVDVYLSDQMQAKELAYTAFPIEGTGRILNERGEETANEAAVCTEPIYGEVKLNQSDAKVLHIGRKDEMLPKEVLDKVLSNIRTVRVGANMYITIPVYSEDGQPVSISTAELVSTNNPAVSALQLTAVRSTANDVTFSSSEALEAGYEYVFSLREDGFSADNCSKGEAAFRIIVVPDRVQWSGDAGNVWNNDASWQTTNGAPAYVPLATTDVILEEGNYRLLSSTAGGALSDEELSMGANPYLQYDINYEPNTCNNIYVPAGAALLNQHLLDITGKPVVEMAIPTKQWVLSAMPVAGGVSGDFWAPAYGENEDPFTVQAISQEVGQPAYDRLVNRVWNALYNTSKINLIDENQTVEISSSTWTSPLNALTTPYPAGIGVAVWVKSIDKNNTNQVTFRFPKTDESYNYWQSNNWHSYAETVSRSSDAGNLAAYQMTAEGMTIQLKNADDSNNIFLFGNPTLAYIDMNELIKGNGAALADTWYVLTDNTPLNSQELTANKKDISTDGADHSLLAPGRAVLLQSNGTDTTLQFTLTPAMLTLPETLTQTEAPRRAKARAEAYALYISATSKSGFTSRAVVQNAWGANDEYRQSEDAALFLMDAEKTPFGIYTLSTDNQPLSINQFADVEQIPLACYAQQQTGTITFGFEGEADYVGEWHLYDAEEGTRTKLVAGMSLQLAIPTDGKVRYYLEKPADITPTPTDEPTIQLLPQVQVVGGKGELSVSANMDMEQIAVYDVVGRLVATGYAASSAQWQLPQGAYVVNVRINDAGQASMVLVR